MGDAPPEPLPIVFPSGNYNWVCGCWALGVVECELERSPRGVIPRVSSVARVSRLYCCGVSYDRVPTIYGDRPGVLGRDGVRVCFGGGMLLVLVFNDLTAIVRGVVEEFVAGIVQLDAVGAVVEI